MGQCISCRDQVIKSARVDVDNSNNKIEEKLQTTPRPNKVNKSTIKQEEVLMKDAVQITDETNVTEKTKTLSDKKKTVEPIKKESDNQTNQSTGILKKRVFKSPRKRKRCITSSKQVSNHKYVDLIESTKEINKSKTDGDVFKIGICGPREAGKTSFVLRFCQNRFDSCYIPSFSEDEVTHKQCVLNMKLFNIIFIVNESINKEVDCYLVLFDYTSESSYNIATSIVINDLSNSNKPIFLIGNKTDVKHRLVDKEKIETFCNEHKCTFFPISVKGNMGISIMMQKLSMVLDKLKNNNINFVF